MYVTKKIMKSTQMLNWKVLNCQDFKKIIINDIAKQSQYLLVSIPINVKQVSFLLNVITCSSNAKCNDDNSGETALP